MNGIFLAIDANHLDRKNVQAALQGWNKLQPSVNVCNFYIKDALTLQDDEEFPPIQDASLAKRVIGHMIHVGIKRGTTHFSLQAYHEFLNRAKQEQPLQFISLAVPLPKRAAKAEIEFDIGEPTVVEKVVKEQTIKPAPAIVVKKEKKLTAKVITPGSGRGRKFNPNSAQHVAKRLYETAVDKSRDAILKLFQQELGLNPGTAMTYYYNARKA